MNSTTNSRLQDRASAPSPAWCKRPTGSSFGRALTGSPRKPGWPSSSETSRTRATRRSPRSSTSLSERSSQGSTADGSSWLKSSKTGRRTPMTCERIEGLLSAFLEGELSPTDKAFVESHLGGCPDCTAMLGVFARAQKALAGFPELEVSPTLLARLAAIPVRKRKFSFSFDFVLKPALQPVFAAATIFMTLLSFYLFNPDKKNIDRAIDQKIKREKGHEYC